MTNGLKDKAAIAGIGETAYTRGSDRSTISLHLEAALKAIDDAGLTPKDIDGIVPNANAGVVAEQYIANLGITDLKFTMTKHQGGASPVASIQDAVTAIINGVAECVLICAGRRGYSEQRVSTSSSRPATMPPNRSFESVHEFEGPFGALGVAQYFAAAARRHMYEYGTTSRHFGAIAVACRKHAMLNPKAFMRKPMTIEDHQNSRMIVDPFHLLDCSLETDGAGAYVVTSAEKAKSLRQRPVYIMGVAEGHPDNPTSVTEQQPMTVLQGEIYAAKRAFAMAEITPKDVDAAELYDGFTWIAFCQLEDIGFCKKGDGGSFVEGGRIELGGELPINTHGGLLSEAHVTGVNHVIEAVRQLRGDCGERQVKDAEIILVSGCGDFGEGSIAILRR